MKIHLFDPETGVYQGEDYSDDLSVSHECKPDASHATTIAPPPYNKGEVPVFRMAENQWEIRRANCSVVNGCGDPGQQTSHLSQPPTLGRTTGSADVME
jgi:hypothetical protein